MASRGTRRAEILETAASMFASSGLRTSLREIADACGIQAGSLYHHFESKEALIVELVERFHADLDGVADEAMRILGSTSIPVHDAIVSFGGAIADCAIKHRAALLLTLYEPPSSAGDELVQVSARSSGAIENAMLETLRRGRDQGAIRHDLDLDAFADRLCQVLLHIGLGVFHGVEGAKDMPGIRCRALLRGIAVDTPEDPALDGSSAFAAAQSTVDGWRRSDDDEDERLPMLRAVARAEFGRRGYEATTVRDIAAAAEISAGTVYRLIGSKDELLGSIMSSFTTIARSGWSAVLRSDSSAVEKLDALTWVNINAVDRFSDEYNIQLAWIRESPPTSADLGTTFAARLKDLRSLLQQGIRGGELAVEGSSAGVRAWSLFELLWMPENLVRDLGPAGALALSRQTLLRGAAVHL